MASISAYEADAAMPVVNVTKEICRLAMQAGHADQDYAALCAFSSSVVARDTHFRIVLMKSNGEVVHVHEYA